MKFISWNVNGLRAAITHGFFDFFNDIDADIFAVQETKMQPDQADFEVPGYEAYWFSAEKKGYSGTLIFTKKTPISVAYGIESKHLDEGRMITVEYDDYYFVTSYSPNAQPELKRIDYRMEYEDDMRKYLCKLAAKKSVILCGDLNVAHNEIDLKNPKTNIGNPGFSYEERGKFSELLDSGFTDSFRLLYPDKKDAYSWWSYRMKAREKNVGWRIDYFVTSKDLDGKIKDSVIYSDILGSDHCPVGIELDI